VQREEVTGKIADQPRGVVGVVDDLHHVGDGSLQEFDELRGRSALDDGVQLSQDGL